jgi:tetratricopeptide (TPR) repeat protein
MKAVLKWMVALAALAGGGWLFSIEVDSEADPYRALGYAAGGLALIAVAAGIAVVPAGRWLVGLIDTLFLPSGGSYTPPALYKLPEWMISQGRYGDALAEYEKIQKHHPRDVAAYEGRLFVLHACMGNTAAAEKLFLQALRRAPKDKVPELQAYMEALRAGTASAPQRSLEE